MQLIKFVRYFKNADGVNADIPQFMFPLKILEKNRTDKFKMCF